MAVETGVWSGDGSPPLGQRPIATTPRASVIIVTFDRERVLVETIRSVFTVLSNQDELIVVDQTPTHEPDTERALGEFAGDPRFTLFHLETPSVPLARNIGARLAKSDTLIYVDDDVVVSAGFIDAHLAYYDDPEVGAVAGHSVDVHGRPYFVEHGAYASKLVGANMSFRRSVLYEIGGFDTNIFSTMREDGECGERLLRHGWRIANGPRCVLTHLAAQGGAGGRARSDDWYRKTYHNYAYALLKRPLINAFSYAPRYIAGTFRHRYPGPRRFLSPSFLWGVFLSGHVAGVRTRLFGDKGPYLSDERPEVDGANASRSRPGRRH